LGGGVVPGAHPLAEVVEGAQFVVPIGAGVALWVVFAGVAGGALGGVVAIAPVIGTAVVVVLTGAAV
jgi:uncharacterized membrane protein